MYSNQFKYHTIANTDDKNMCQRRFVYSSALTLTTWYLARDVEQDPPHIRELTEYVRTTTTPQ